MGRGVGHPSWVSIPDDGISIEPMAGVATPLPCSMVVSRLSLSRRCHQTAHELHPYPLQLCLSQSSLHRAQCSHAPAQGRRSMARAGRPSKQHRCRAHMAHIRQSGPDSGRGFQTKVLETFHVVLFFLGVTSEVTAISRLPHLTPRVCARRERLSLPGGAVFDRLAFVSGHQGG